MDITRQTTQWDGTASHSSKVAEGDNLYAAAPVEPGALHTCHRQCKHTLATCCARVLSQPHRQQLPTSRAAENHAACTFIRLIHMIRLVNSSIWLVNSSIQWVDAIHPQLPLPSYCYSTSAALRCWNVRIQMCQYMARMIKWVTRSKPMHAHARAAALSCSPQAAAQQQLLLQVTRDQHLPRLP